MSDGEHISDWQLHDLDPRAVAVGAPQDAADDACTDTANARRLVAEHGGAARYCYAHRRWYVFDGTRWARDDGDRSMALAKQTARRMLEEAITEEDKDRRKKLTKWAETTLIESCINNA